MHLRISRFQQYFICLSLTLLSLLAYSADFKESVSNRVSVYSHGWPESGPGEGRQGPTYPDSHGQIWKACFYTRPAVILLANYLKETLDKNPNAVIDLKGRSCGAGIALNLIAKLVNYQKDSSYFNGTQIKSQEDANKILDSINNGTLHLTVPLLDLNHTRYPQYIERVFNALLGGVIAYNCKGKKMITRSGVMIAVGGALFTYCVTNVVSKVTCGSSIQEGLATFIERALIPLSGNFDRDHLKPIDAVDIIKDKLICPTLLHYCKSDEVLSNQEADVKKVYDILKKNNEHVHLVESPVCEGFHNLKESKIHADHEKWFRNQYQRVQHESVKAT